MDHASSSHMWSCLWSRGGVALILMSAALLAACGEPDPDRSVIILEPEADACDAARCDSPPAPSCDGQVSVSYAAKGACLNGVCSYPQARVDCAVLGELCRAGQCLPPEDRCAEVTCQAPPAPSCDGQVSVSYAAEGACLDGVCSYPQARVDCAAAGQACLDGVCGPPAGPCSLVTCDSPPAPSCEEQVSVSYAAAGTCQDGACSYAAQRADCAASAKRCAAGRCVKEVVQISAGEHFMCASHQDGSVWCWGSNNRGQLGDGAVRDRVRPVEVNGLRDVVQISAGAEHICALRRDGRVLCWGFNLSGQLGDDTSLDQRSPTLVSGLQDVVQISAGEAHTCAVHQDGAVSCWGRNLRGQLGDGTRTGRQAPRTVIGLQDAVEVRAGSAHTCARHRDGSASCWGMNEYGQLGDGGVADQRTPIPVAGLQQLVELSLGGGHSCARHQDGSVSCWGYGIQGQLGHQQSRGPATVTGLSDVVQISAGRSHTCALDQGGSVLCWGSNSSGQLGDGAEGPQSRRGWPRAVVDLSQGVEVRAGGAHTCARRQDGALLCWGFNRYGQLGDGTTTSRLVPTLVMSP